jgi:hypothetical protein
MDTRWMTVSPEAKLSFAPKEGPVALRSTAYTGYIAVTYKLTNYLLTPRQQQTVYTVD